MILGGQITGVSTATELVVTPTQLDATTK
jgi:hypothetical protein